MKTVARSESVNVTCATEVFIATALLHRDYPQRTEFTIKEIVARAARENITGEMRPGVNIHASQHCVANKAPNPARLRMLYATGTHTRRLLAPGDPTHAERTGKVFPDPGEVPERYLSLLEWAKKRYEEGRSHGTSRSEGGLLGWAKKKYEGRQRVAPPTVSPLPNLGAGESTDKQPDAPERWLGSLFELEGLGREHWKNVDPDEFVRKLREGWE